MSGATGAGSAGTPTGTETDGGGRGSAAHGAGAGSVTDPHTTNLKPVKVSAKDSAGTSGSQGGTVTDTRGPAAAGEAQSSSPLPGERSPEQPSGPYHPPQAYPAQPP
ncbi:DUF3566 domain-containing protein, partial [Streptomyces sp. NPDC003233]